MLEILQHCNSEYLPKCTNTTEDDEEEDKIIHRVAFGGDHLTVERAVSAVDAVKDSDSPYERLEGIIIKHEDFHCEMNVLQVIYCPISFCTCSLHILFEINFLYSPQIYIY